MFLYARPLPLIPEQSPDRGSPPPLRQLPQLGRWLSFHLESTGHRARKGFSRPTAGVTVTPLSLRFHIYKMQIKRDPIWKDLILLCFENRLALDSQCSQKWTWTSDPTASSLEVLELQARNAHQHPPNFRECWDQTWDLVHARQALF